MPQAPRRTSQDAPRRGGAALERHLVLFTVGDVVYGLTIERVREVMAPQAFVPLPHAPHAVVGVTDHRGEVVPVVDLRARFLLAPQDDPESQRRRKWILVDLGEPGAARLVAVLVDAVLQVHLSREPLRPAPPLGGGEADRGIGGVVARPAGDGTDGGMVFVLDPLRLRALIEPVAQVGSAG